MRPRLRRVQSAGTSDQVIGFWSEASAMESRRQPRGENPSLTWERPAQSRRLKARGQGRFHACVKRRMAGRRIRKREARRGRACRNKVLATGAGRGPLRDGGAKGCIVEQVEWCEMVDSGAKYCLVVRLLGA